MPATSLTDSPLRELAHRVSSGAEITLLWNESTGAAAVSVWNRDSGQQVKFAAAPARALEAFYHPYAHAASRRVRWDGTPRGA
jgi:hypothetical protein